MSKKEITLIVVMVLLSIVLVIGGTYAYYLATVTGNDAAEEITIASGYLELTFAEDGNNITMENALPGSQDEKTFTVTNTSTADASFTYNIKLAGVVTDFEQQDLEYTLQEYEDENYETPKEDGTTATGYINADTINEEGEMYLAININAPEKGQKQYYKLTIEFKETDENQDYNKGKSFVGKINGDDNRDAALYEGPKAETLLEICNSNDSLNECLAKGKQVKNIYADDPDNNIRYAGPSEEVNNYIWFNCDSYDGVTKETAASKNCEKWRIIGLFWNVPRPSSEPEDLVKIIRNDSVGTMKWDNYNGYGSSDWARPAYLNTSLASYYNGTTLNSAKGITKQTRSMIEYVTWNIGALDTYVTAAQFYTAERGIIVPNNGAPSTWNGDIGLMYPSDYGYATTGSNSGSNRDTCLATTLNNYNSNSGCRDKDWLYISGSTQWTLTTLSNDIYTVLNVDNYGSLNFDGASFSRDIRPTLYLKSTIQIVGGNGTSDEPYIIKRA